MLVARGENHRESGVTLKARVTWVPVNDSHCTVFSTPAIREGQATRPLDFAVEFLTSADAHLIPWSDRKPI